MKREMKKIFALVLLACVIFSLSACTRKESVSEFWAMDTYCKVTVYGGDSEIAEKAVFDAEKLIKGDNGDGRLFAETEKSFSVSEEVADLILLSVDISEKTDGLFDITVAPLSALWDVSNRTVPPADDEIVAAQKLVGYEKLSMSESTVSFFEYGMGIDLGGVGKGFAAKLAVQRLLSAGVEEAVVNLGGNISVIGDKDGVGYKIGIRDPYSSGLVGNVKVSDTSVVTSGSYERNFVYNGKTYHHIIDPKTGRPAESGLVSATVICSNPVAADALSTAFFAVGKNGADELFDRCSSFGLEGVILITEDKKVVLLGKAEDIFTLTGEGYSLEK